MCVSVCCMIIITEHIEGEPREGYMHKLVVKMAKTAHILIGGFVE